MTKERWNDNFNRFPNDPEGTSREWQKSVGMTKERGNDNFNRFPHSREWQKSAGMTTSTDSRMTQRVPRGNDKRAWEWQLQQIPEWPRGYPAGMTKERGNDNFKRFPHSREWQKSAGMTTSTDSRMTQRVPRGNDKRAWEWQL